MSDTPTTAPVVPAQPAAIPGISPAPPEPATPPAAPVDPLAGMTPDQIDALGARIEQARANRPESLAAMLDTLKDELSGAHQAKQQAVQKKREGLADADTAVAEIAKIHATLRRTELVEAATAAQFAVPTVVARDLANLEGDAATLVTEAAKSGAYAMKTPATSAQIGWPASQTPPDMDPGIAALVAEINAAHGRT